jgi:hypothetical protein
MVVAARAEAERLDLAFGAPLTQSLAAPPPDVRKGFAFPEVLNFIVGLRPEVGA